MGGIGYEWLVFPAMIAAMCIIWCICYGRWITVGEDENGNREVRVASCFDWRGTPIVPEKHRNRNQKGDRLQLIGNPNVVNDAVVLAQG